MNLSLLPLHTLRDLIQAGNRKQRVAALKELRKRFRADTTALPDLYLVLLLQQGPEKQKPSPLAALRRRLRVAPQTLSPLALFELLHHDGQTRGREIVAHLNPALLADPLSFTNEQLLVLLHYNRDDPLPLAAALTELRGRFEADASALSDHCLHALVREGQQDERTAPLAALLERYPVPLSVLPDVCLLALILGGSLYQRNDALKVYMDWLLVWVRFQFPNLPNDHGDVMQEAIARLHANATRLDSRGCRGWLREVARNIAIEYLRRAERGGGTDYLTSAEEVPSGAVSHEEVIDAQLDVAGVEALREQLLQVLPDHLREVWVRKNLRRQTLEQIAEALNISTTTACRLHQQACAIIDPLLNHYRQEGTVPPFVSCLPLAPLDGAVSNP